MKLCREKCEEAKQNRNCIVTECVGDGYNEIMYNRDEYVLCIKDFVTAIFFIFHVSGGEMVGGCTCNVVFGAEEHGKRWSGQNLS